MLEKYKVYLTKKNICLIGIIIICMILILYTAINMIFPDYDLNRREKRAAKNTVEKFIEGVYKNRDSKIENYMVEEWTAEEVKKVFLGGEEIESLKIDNIKHDGYSQYAERYTKNRKKKGEELTGDKYASITADVKHDYKEESEYEDEVKKLVFLLEKKNNEWKIVTIGTRTMMDSLI